MIKPGSPKEPGLFAFDENSLALQPGDISVVSRKRKLTGLGYAADTFGVGTRRLLLSVASQLPLPEHLLQERFGVVDMIKLNRIGNKLGLAGAIGVLLAVGMVANQMVTEARIEEVGERAARSQHVADSSLSAHIDLRKIQLAARDVRLARTPGEVEKTIADLQRYKESEAKQLDAALATAQRQDTRDRLQKIKSLME